MRDQGELIPAPPAHDPGGKSKPAWRPGARVSASFAGALDCYRLSLTEAWDDALPAVMFQMMNPSTAGIANSDPTLMKTGKFARAWGFGRQLIGNDHAYRATDKLRLLDVPDPVGPGNDAALLAMAAQCDLIVLAQGQPPKRLQARSRRVIDLFIAAGHGPKLHYLRLSKEGQPWHPLYIPDSAVPLPYPLPVT